MSCVRSAPACVICLQANRAFFLYSAEFNLFLVGYYLFLCQLTFSFKNPHKRSYEENTGSHRRLCCREQRRGLS